MERLKIFEKFWLGGYIFYKEVNGAKWFWVEVIWLLPFELGLSQSALELFFKCLLELWNPVGDFWYVAANFRLIISWIVQLNTKVS